MNVNGGPPPAADLHLISIERGPDRPPSARLPPPGPNYVFRRVYSLNVFLPDNLVDPINGGASAETPPPPLELHDPILEYLDLLSILNAYQKRDCHYGRFTLLFGGRIVLGDGKWIFLASLVMYASLLGNTVFMKSPLEKHCEGFELYVTGIVLGLLTLCTFAILGATDPGVIPKNHSLRELLAETEGYRAAHPNEKYFMHCFLCGTYRPPGAGHCEDCDICVRGHDFHLESAGTCIGERNRRSYFFHVIFLNFYGAYLLATAWIITIQIKNDWRANTKELIQVIVSALGGIVLWLSPDLGIISRIYWLVKAGACTGKWRNGIRSDCVVDKLPVWLKVREFFCQKSMPSVFRRQLNQVDPDSRQDGLTETWILEHRRWPRSLSNPIPGPGEYYQRFVNDFDNANHQLGGVNSSLEQVGE